MSIVSGGEICLVSEFLGLAKMNKNDLLSDMNLKIKQ